MSSVEDDAVLERAASLLAEGEPPPLTRDEVLALARSALERARGEGADRIAGSRDLAADTDPDDVAALASAIRSGDPAPLDDDEIPARGA